MAITKETALIAIKLAYQEGELLGMLVDRFGVDLVVEGLGVNRVAWILGVNESVPDDSEEE